jgi:hypothetical protein
MAGAVACNVGAAVMDVFGFVLLIPFLNALFQQPALSGANALGGLLEAVIGRLLDPRDQMGSLQNVILVILASVALKSLFSWAAGNFGAALQEYVTRDLRNAVYAHLQRLPLGYFGRTKGGQILSRVLNDTAQTKQVITELISKSLLSGATVLITFWALVRMSWQLTLVAVVGVPLLIGALQPLLRKLRKGYRRTGDEQGELTAVVQETIGGIRLVKSFGGEAYEERRFRLVSDRLAKGLTRVARVNFLAQPVTETVATGIAWRCSGWARARCSSPRRRPAPRSCRAPRSSRSSCWSCGCCSRSSSCRRSPRRRSSRWRRPSACSRSSTPPRSRPATRAPAPPPPSRARSRSTTCRSPTSRAARCWSGCASPRGAARWSPSSGRAGRGRARWST